MLRIYICPKCFNFRMVSRKPDAICLHCGSILSKCEIDYQAYVNMNENDRKEYKENYINRMRLYHENLNQVQSVKRLRTFK